MSAELKRRAAGGINADQLLVEAFALVREVSRRTLGLYPFDVQVMAGIALHNGKIVEMQTGEGKTLAAVMPAYLNALGSKGVHIFTFNDYLARRDAAWMGPVYEFLGLTTGYVQETMSISERQAAYSCHVTYLTAKEAGFDYLRDFLCTEAKNLVHRPFHYAIVDEADSIFIDEARIPLVIAGNVPEAAESPLSLARLVAGFHAGEDYEIDRCNRNVYLTDTGLSRAEQELKCGNLYAPENLELLTRLNCALFAGVLLERDKDYIFRNGKIELIDEFTGRVAVKRLWPDNLQAAVEAKEGLLPASRGKILGSIALQHFLNLYPRLAGMTGTARPAAAEFNEFYNMNVVVIPTNKPCIRQDHPNLIFTHREAKQQALLREIADLRIQLWKYSFIIEQQRRIIHKKRQDILLDRVQLQLLSNAAAGRYALLRSRLGVKALQKAEKQLTLYHINRCWADYLDYISYVREGIHLVVIGRQNPLEEFHRLAASAFQEMLERIDKEIVKSFMTVKIGKDGIDMQKEGLSGPSSTWTYLINENPDQFSRLPFLIKAAETAIQGPLFNVQPLIKSFLKISPKRNETC
jgi:preprotein translocase subunit SecA